MPDIRKFLENWAQFYPEILESAVHDENGGTLDVKLSVLGTNLVRAMRVFALYLGEVESTTTITSPEWSFVITDNEGKILAGVRVDGTVFIADI